MRTQQISLETPIIISESDISLETDKSNDLPILCIIDSGISNIFYKYAEHVDSNHFSDRNDIIGHGTEVSSLALFGERLINKQRDLINEIKIISYKIEDDSSIVDNLIDEIIIAVEKYHNKTKVFSISYNYTDINLEERIDFLTTLDKVIQNYNVIVCISAGNIDINDIIQNQNNYPNYLTFFPVL